MYHYLNKILISSKRKKNKECQEEYERRWKKNKENKKRKEKKWNGEDNKNNEKRKKKHINLLFVSWFGQLI